MFFQRAKMGKIWNLIIGWRHSFIRQKEWHIFYFSSCLGCQEIQRYILQLEEEFSFIWIGIIILYFVTLNANPWTVSLWMLKAILCLLILQMSCLLTSLVSETILEIHFISDIWHHSVPFHRKIYQHDSWLRGRQRRRWKLYFQFGQKWNYTCLWLFLLWNTTKRWNTFRIPHLRGTVRSSLAFCF